MIRAQRFIAAVISAEKEERVKAKKVDKITLGYDPEKWIKRDAEIRNEDRLSTDYVKIDLPPPHKGKHRFTSCQRMYEEVHVFLGQRKWAYAHPESNASGVTWAELFILFDTGGYRTIEGQHIKDKAAAERAVQRKAKEKKPRRSKCENTLQNSATTKATYDQEITVFKAIVRQIARHDLADHKKKGSTMKQGTTLEGLHRLE